MSSVGFVIAGCVMIVLLYDNIKVSRLYAMRVECLNYAITDLVELTGGKDAVNPPSSSTSARTPEVTS